MSVQPDWMEWFDQNLVKPYPTGLITELTPDDVADTAVSNLTAPGLLYDSHIMFLGDIRVTRRRSVAMDACPYIYDSSFLETAVSFLPLVDIELQNEYVAELLSSVVDCGNETHLFPTLAGGTHLFVTKRVEIKNKSTTRGASTKMKLQQPN